MLLETAVFFFATAGPPPHPWYLTQSRSLSSRPAVSQELNRGILQPCRLQRINYRPPHSRPNGAYMLGSLPEEIASKGLDLLSPARYKRQIQHKRGKIRTFAADWLQTFSSYHATFNQGHARILRRKGLGRWTSQMKNKVKNLERQMAFKRMYGPFTFLGLSCMVCGIWPKLSGSYSLKELDTIVSNSPFTVQKHEMLESGRLQCVALAADCIIPRALYPEGQWSGLMQAQIPDH